MNSVHSSFLEHMTDDQIRAGVIENRNKLVRRAFPGVDVAASSVAEALGKAGANFHVEKHPLLIVNHVDGLEGGDDVTISPFPAHRATVRTDTMTPLGIVGANTYGVVQTGEALASLDVLAKRGDLAIVNVRIANGGGRIGVTALLGVSKFLSCDGAPNTIVHFGQFLVTHDGSAADSYSLYSLRVECFNGMTSRHLIHSHKLRHTSKAGERVAKFSESILRDLIGDAEAEREVFLQLVNKPMDFGKFQDFSVELLGGALAEDVGKRERTIRENAVNVLDSYFLGGNQGAGATAWGAYNSVTRWIEAKREKLDDAAKAAAKFDSNASGANQRKVSKALRLLTR